MFAPGGMSHCKQCDSERMDSFGSELAIHFGGLEGLDKPIVWLFPELLVCLSCGFTEFMVPERELQVLETGTSVGGGAVRVGSREGMKKPI